jgi:diphosphomevalonate decarboxylase
MQTRLATAVACANIAFIKYWGNSNHELRLPVNGSISMNLAGLETRTTVAYDTNLDTDQLSINGKESTPTAQARVTTFLDNVRQLSGLNGYAQVTSENNFPTGAGLASSASAFAALALAATTAAGLQLDEAALSRLARLGSGSASRSVPGGFVEWHAGDSHESSYAESIALTNHWDLVDCVVVVSEHHKSTISSDGHKLASTSPIQKARIQDAGRRLDICREALLHKDFHTFAEIVELDSNLMHAVMMTSNPPLLYWQPGTLAVMQAVQTWRAEGLDVCYTIDAGPNVHVLCLGAALEKVEEQLREIEGVLNVIVAHPGGPAQLD